MDGTAAAFCSVLSATQAGKVSILKALLQGPTSRDDVEKSLLYACREGLADCLECLLAAGVDPNIEDPSGNSLLHHAVNNGHHRVVQMLCDAGVNVNQRGAWHNTPLHVAARWGKEECTQILLRHGSKIDAVDSFRSTPLMLAIKNKQYTVIGELLEAGCDVNSRDKDGRTALHYASHTAVSVQRLLDKGAEVNVVDNQGCSPLIMAASEGLDNVVHALTQAPGCNPNLANYSVRKTPLHILASKGHFRSILDLLGCGADLSLPDGEGKTGMWHAVARGRTRVVAVLLQHTSHVDSSQCPGKSATSTLCPVRLALDRGCVDILKLFIISHYDSTHLRECLAHPQADVVFQQARQWLNLGRQVPSLQQTCRRSIRHFLGYSLATRCSRLPLPEKLIDFLMIKELNDSIS